MTVQLCSESNTLFSWRGACHSNGKCLSMEPVLRGHGSNSLCKLVQEINTSLLPVFLMVRYNPYETKSTGNLLFFHIRTVTFTALAISVSVAASLSYNDSPLALPSCHSAEKKTWDILPAHELD